MPGRVCQHIYGNVCRLLFENLPGQQLSHFLMIDDHIARACRLRHAGAHQDHRDRHLFGRHLFFFHRNDDQRIGAILLFPVHQVHLLFYIQLFIQGDQLDIRVKLGCRQIHSLAEITVIIAPDVLNNHRDLVDLPLRLTDDQIRGTHQKQHHQTHDIENYHHFSTSAYHVRASCAVSAYACAGRWMLMTVPSSGSDQI